MGRYPANKLMIRGPLVGREELLPPFAVRMMPPGDVSEISPSFPGFYPSHGQVVHAFLALPPLSRADSATFPIPSDLHA